MIVPFKFLKLCGQKSVQQTTCEPRAEHLRLTQVGKYLEWVGFSDSRPSASNYRWTEI